MSDTERMNASDKIKTACWFRRISDQIMTVTWPEDELEDVKNRVERFRATADRLEAEVLEGRK